MKQQFIFVDFQRSRRKSGGYLFRHGPEHGLQQGTAFFASNSIFAIGGCFALPGSTDAVLGVLVRRQFFPAAREAVLEDG